MKSFQDTPSYIRVPTTEVALVDVFVCRWRK